MDEQTRNDMRRSTTGRRQPPPPVTRVVLRPDGNGLFPETLEPGPIDLQIEATITRDETAPWYRDEWWTEVISYLSALDIAVHFMPTPGAIVHPVVLHHVNMIRRVVPLWRVVGHAYRDDLTLDHDIDALANSLFHEIRVIDARRPGAPASDRGVTDIGVDELFGRIRRTCRLPRHPVLIRLAAEETGPRRDRSRGSSPADRAADPAFVASPHDMGT